jgi:hypothetical protein
MLIMVFLLLPVNENLKACHTKETITPCLTMFKLLVKKNREKYIKIDNETSTENSLRVPYKLKNTKPIRHADNTSNGMLNVRNKDDSKTNNGSRSRKYCNLSPYKGGNE